MKSPKIHPPDTDDNESHGLEYSFTSSLHSPEGLNPSSDYKNFSPKEKVQVQTAETQTALAIDPQTSVKLSFISAGLSTYGNTIEDTFYTKSDHRSTRKFHETIATGRSTFQDSNVDPRFSREFKNQRIPATPPRNNITQPTPPRHVHYSSPNRSERYNQHIDAVIESDSEEDVPVPSRPNIDLNQSLSEIPTSTIPPKTPLKSILRTPIRAPATPLSNPSAFNRNIQMLSPAMSPIHADHGETDAHFDPHTTGMFDASDSDISVPQPKGQREESFHPQTQSFQANASQRSFSLAELQHLSYLDLSTGSHQNPTPAYPNDSILTTSTGFDTLHSMSLLDITSNTSHSQPAKSKKKSSRRKKISSSDRYSSDHSFLNPLLEFARVIRLLHLRE